MTCQQKGCEASAVFEVFWPGQTTRQCEEHTQALRNLNEAMSGAPLTVFMLPASLLMEEDADDGD